MSRSTLGLNENGIICDKCGRTVGCADRDCDSSPTGRLRIDMAGAVLHTKPLRHRSVLAEMGARWAGEAEPFPSRLLAGVAWPEGPNAPVVAVTGSCKRCKADFCVYAKELWSQLRFATQWGLRLNRGPLPDTRQSPIMVPEPPVHVRREMRRIADQQMQEVQALITATLGGAQAAEVDTVTDSGHDAAPGAIAHH